MAYGAAKYRGMGRAAGGVVSAPPTSPQNGSGGAGALRLPGVDFDFSAAASEISDATTGRITLGMVNLTILALIGFYIWTRSAQGGG